MFKLFIEVKQMYAEKCQGGMGSSDVVLLL